MKHYLVIDHFAREREHRVVRRLGTMRLCEFMLANVDPILTEWASFARGNWPGPEADIETLRDHAADILRTIATDMQSKQTLAEQQQKSLGEGLASAHSDAVGRASTVHALTRLRSGFDVMLLIAEYRALRASVLRLWRASKPEAHLQDLDDVTRFNEAIDQSLADALSSYTREVDRSREMFLAILGHDLRNPLTSISLIANFLTLQERIDPSARKMLSQVQASTAAMGRIVNDLLDFTSTRLGKSMPLLVRPMDLARLCDEVISEIRAGHPECQLHAGLPPSLQGDWDAMRLRQVVSNLLGNAIQHGDPATPITLKLGTDRSDADQAIDDDEIDVVLTVHNGGEPIPPDRRGAIFDPLVHDITPRLANRRRREGSLGLGLYIAREIVHSHAGTIEVASSAEAGTTFTVRLPRRSPSTNAAISDDADHAPAEPAVGT